MVRGAIESLKFRRNNDVISENKAGTFVYSGEAAKYHDWEFRTELLMSCTDEDSQGQTIAKIVSGLRGDAMQIARDIGLEVLKSEKGLQTLIQQMRNFVFSERAR